MKLKSLKWTLICFCLIWVIYLRDSIHQNTPALGGRYQIFKIVLVSEKVFKSGAITEGGSSGGAWIEGRDKDGIFWAIPFSNVAGWNIIEDEPHN